MKVIRADWLYNAELSLTEIGVDVVILESRDAGGPGWCHIVCKNEKVMTLVQGAVPDTDRLENSQFGRPQLFANFTAEDIVSLLQANIEGGIEVEVVS